MPIQDDKIDQIQENTPTAKSNSSQDFSLVNEAKLVEDQESSDYQDFTNLPPDKDNIVSEFKNTSEPETAKQKVEKTVLANLFEACAKFALPVIFLLLAFLVLQQLYSPRDLWYSDEVRHADVYTNMVQSQDFLALELNGEKYPDKPPLYFWFMAGLEKYTNIHAEQLFFLALVLSTFLFIFTAWALAKLTDQDKRVSFAACLILLTCPYFIGLTHYARMDMLFAACIVASHFCLFRAFSKPRAYIWVSCGFILAALATLIKGPYGALMPLLSIIVYLFSKGKFKRAGARDGAFGFALMLIILLTWVSALILSGNKDYISIIASEQVIGRASNAWHHANNWYYYLIWLPIVFIPYIFTIFFINWKNFFFTLPSKIKQRKTKPLLSDGTRFLVLALVSNFIMISLVSTKIAIYLLPLFPFIAILLAKVLLNLSARASQYFYSLLASIYLLVALAFALLAFAPYIIPRLSSEYLLKLPTNTDVYLAKASGFSISAILFLALALFIIFMVNKRKAQGALLANCLALLICVQPLILITAPSLSPLLSPKNAALMLSNYAQEGYSIASYKTYRGVLSYYAKQQVPNINEVDELKTWLETHENVAIFMSEKRYQELAWLELELIDKFFMAERFYVLLARSKADLNKNSIEDENIIELPKPDLPELPETTDLENPNSTESTEYTEETAKPEMPISPEEEQVKNQQYASLNTDRLEQGVI